MKILITSDFYLPVITGVTNVIFTLKDRLEEKGHDVRILTFTKNKKSYYDKNNKEYFFKSLKIQFYKDSLNGINIYDPLMKEIYKWNPDIIHSQTEFFSMRYAKRISKKTNTPIIHTWHTNFHAYCNKFYISKKLYFFFLNIILHKSLKPPVYRIIAPSESTKNMIINDFNIKLPVEILPSGINIKKFSSKLENCDYNSICLNNNIDRNKFKIITVSRLSKEKDISILIKYFAKLSKKYKNIQYIIVGDGPEKTNLEKLSEKLNIKDSVIFCGEIEPSKTHLYYKCADIFISGSLNETQGLTYFEALASKLPIICRENSVLNKILIEGKNGFSFKNVKEFIDRFDKVINDDELYNYLKSNTVTSIEEHSESKFIEKLLNLYTATIQYN